MNGAMAKGDNAGGGSGGTIIIQTEVLSGHGSLHCNGGRGLETGGGGAGGRMVINVNNV